MNEEKYFNLYKELVEIVDKLRPFYDIDKIKSYSVYAWSKGEHGKNVFDILCDEIMFYEKHEIIEKAKPIIEEIQEKLKELKECCNEGC